MLTRGGRSKPCNEECSIIKNRKQAVRQNFSSFVSFLCCYGRYMKIGHYISILWFLLPSFFLFTPLILRLCRAISSQPRHVKQQYLPHMSSQYGELRPTSSWDRFVSLGHPSKFQRVSHLGFVTAATSLNGSQPNFARCLRVSWAGRVCIHIRRLFAPNGILPSAKFTLRLSLALSYIDSVTARQSSSGRQPNCGVEQRAPPLFGRAAITLSIGPHSSC